MCMWMPVNDVRKHKIQGHKESLALTVSLTIVKYNIKY